MFSLHKLDTGLRVLTAPTNTADSATVLLFAGAGSRYERRERRGISHFLEHMFFKGGKKYPTALSVSRAIDGLGGEFNAFTGKEYAGYYVKIATQHLDTACDVLSDMLLSPQFRKEDAEKEKRVIIEELRMYEDTPMYKAGWDFEELLYGDQPLGWDTIGTLKTIQSLTPEHLRAHHARLYTAANCVLTFAGAIEEGRTLKLAGKFFRGLKGLRREDFPKCQGGWEKHVHLREKKTEQSHLVLGCEGVSALHSNHFAMQILAVILGGNMSSRMCQRIREDLGLCYYIQTTTDNYLDTGVLSTRAGVDQSRLHEAVEAIVKEYLRAAERGVTHEELARAKEYLKGKITLSLEDSEERAHFFGKQALLYPKTYSIPEYFRKIEKVTKEQTESLAQELLKPDRLRLVVIGKEQGEAKLESLLRGGKKLLLGVGAHGG
jgi:predicted Zn-dependent peptidase